jgi:hypothetical protein
MLLIFELRLMTSIDGPRPLTRVAQRWIRYDLYRPEPVDEKSLEQLIQRIEYHGLPQASRSTYVSATRGRLIKPLP